MSGYSAGYTGRDDGEGEVVPVTVCVAAMCGGDAGTMVLGASDRMLTAGDVQFEPPQTKTYVVTSSIAVMTAGDSALQTEVLNEVASSVEARLDKHPDEWLSVRFVAQLYRLHYDAIRAARAESAVLAPLGLNHDSFIKRQKEMSPELTRQLASELVNFDMPKVATIVLGVDERGAHIYTVLGPEIMCNDSAGFAAVGVGRWHAQSQFMFAGHTRFRPFPETLLLTYSAKKRAEVAPGVGAMTDMFVIGPNLGTYNPISDEHISKLQKIYAETRKQVKKAAVRAEESVNRYVQEIIDATTVKRQEETPSDGQTAQGEGGHGPGDGPGEPV